MKKIFLILNFSFLIVSCTAPIDIRVRAGEERIAVYSTLFGDEIHQRVTVQRTMPFFSSDLGASWIPDATVTISSSRGEIYHTWWDVTSNGYITREAFAAVPGVTYTLDVEFDFDSDGTAEHYTASTTPLAPAMKVYAAEIVPTKVVAMFLYRFLIFGEEPAGKDFYVTRIAINDVIRQSRLEHWGLQDDRLFDGSRFDGMTVATFDSERGFDPESREENNWVKPGDEVTLLISNVDEDFFYFISETRQSNGASNPFFGGPPYNARTNISGGAVGYFGSLCPMRVSAVVP
jgi:hypothetical protein